MHHAAPDPSDGLSKKHVGQSVVRGALCSARTGTGREKMNGISYYFMVLAVICAVLGMALGIHMSASHDHTMAPVHAHMNLIGWVSMAIFAGYYHAVAKARQGLLPRIHLGLSLLGVIVIVPGIAMAILEKGEGLAAAGSFLTLASMLVFLLVVIRAGKAAG
jgi:uncharacterized membrane protein